MVERVLRKINVEHRLAKVAWWTLIIVAGYLHGLRLKPLAAANRASVPNEWLGLLEEQTV